MTIIEDDFLYEEIWNSCGLQIMKARMLKVGSSLALRIDERIFNSVDLNAVSRDIYGSIFETY